MNEEVKRKWVARLRSGRDQQARGALRSPAGLCCLGVLCEIAVEEGVIPKPKETKGFHVFHYGDDEMGLSASLLPGTVVDWAGTGGQNPAVPSRGLGYNTLSGANDGGLTFNEIADLIEEYL